MARCSLVFFSVPFSLLFLTFSLLYLIPEEYHSAWLFFEPSGGYSPSLEELERLPSILGLDWRFLAGLIEDLRMLAVFLIAFLFVSFFLYVFSLGIKKLIFFLKVT